MSGIGGQGPGGFGGGNGGFGGGNNNSVNNHNYDYRNYSVTNYIQNTYHNNNYDYRNYGVTNNHYDYSTTTINNPPGPGGAGGGGNNRGGGGGGGLLTSPLGLNAIALGTTALPAAATAVTDLAGAVQQLAQAGLVIPGVMAGAASSVGTLAIGLSGVKDAFSSVWEAAKSGDAKDIEKAAEALDDISPAAQSAVKSFAQLRPQIEHLRRDVVQENMFAGIDESITDLANRSMPTFEKGLGGIATAWNSTFKEIARVGKQDGTQGLLDQIFGNTAEGQNRANNAIEPLINAFGTLAKEGSYFLPRLGDAITDVADRFNRFIQSNTKNGNIFRWIDEGLNGMRAFGNSVLNVGKIITNLTKAAGSLQGSLSGDGGILGWLERTTGAMEKFTASAAGQEKLSEFFRGGRESMADWGRIFAELGPVLMQVIEGFQTWGNVLLPIIEAVGNLLNALSQIPGLVEAIVVGFLAFKTLGPIIGGVTGSIGTLSSTLGSARVLAGGAGLAASAAATSSDSGVTQVIGAVGAIASGALIGSVFGPIGTGVGAGVGAAIAGITYLLGENARAAAAAADAQAQYAETLSRSRAAIELSSQAQKSLTDSLFASGGAIDPAAIDAVGDLITQLPDKLAGTWDDDKIKAMVDSLKSLNLTTEQLSTIVTGAQPGFDALIGRLNSVGPGGQLLASQLASIRDTALGAASNAATAAPLLQTLSQTMNVDIPQAAANVANAFAGLPKDVPINLDMPQGPAVLDILTKIGAEVTTDQNTKNIVVTAPLAPQVLEQLRQITGLVINNNDKTISVSIDSAKYVDTLNKLDTLGAAYKNLFSAQLNLPNVPTPNTSDPNPFGLPPTKPRAEGGVLPGYSPGVDNMLVPMSGGEGVIIPEAMRALGSRWLYNLNSSFRSGLSRRGYANGGVVGFADGGIPHLGTGDLPGDPVVGLLSEIRDLLAGKGGTASNPLAATAANTGQLSTAVDKADASGQQLGPFGTPIKPRHRGYEAAAAAIQALGGDPEKWLGADPATLPISQGGILPDQIGALPGMPGAGGADYAKYAAVLSAFAQSGNLGPDLAALGLDANDPVIKAITTARNKKKGALGGDAIAALVDQVVGGGGYSGTLDSSNSALISALQTFRDKLGKPSRTSTAAAVSGLPIVGGGPKGSKAGLLPAASQLWDLIAANFPQVTEIGGVRQDPHPDHPSGRALDIMIPGGTTRGGANPAGKALGDQMWQFLVSNGLIDPTGSLWQTDTGGDHFNHIHARIAEGMENALNTSGLISPTASGLGAAGLTSSGGVVPVYVTNFDGQMRGGEFGKQIVDAAATAAGGAGADVAGDVLSAGLGVGHRPLPEDTVDASQLAAERNPNVFAALAGFQVGDYNRTGSQGQADNLMTNEGPGYNAQGQLYSDTTALLDRSFTSLSAQIKASFDQMQDVIGQVRDKLTEDALKPIMKAAVSEGVSEIKDAALASIGTTMGQSAGPPIADAVRSAIPSDSGSGGGEIANTVAAAVPGMAAGGPVYGGVPGKDSVPSLLMPGEHVLTTDDVSRMGGQAGVYAFRAALARNGGVRGFATGGGVIVNDTVGAEFFGVSQIPILGAIVNLLVRVLLAVLGVQIEARDTLNEMTSEFRQFRGDFQAFDATGRLLNDTSALMERSQSSEELAAQERIRILKIVLQALIKYIIEKVIVPIAKAVANAAINAGGAAAGAAINTQAPGAGGIVSSLISSAGTAGVDIAAEIGSEIAVQASAVIIDMIASGLQSYFPDAVGAIFGGGLMEQLIAAPITAALAMPLAILGSLTGGLGSLLGPLAAVLGGGGGLFDSGGVASGIGLMPKAIIAPERVLSPSNTVAFDRLPDKLERLIRALESNSGSGPTVQAEIHVAGGPEAGENVRNGLLELMRG